MGIVDFTNPAAVKWYVGCLEQLFDAGVDAIKTDFGERIPSKDVQWFDESVDPGRMHNYYAFIYNKVVYEALQKRYGNDQAVLFARTATTGTQRFPLVSLFSPSSSSFPIPLQSLALSRSLNTILTKISAMGRRLRIHPPRHGRVHPRRPLPRPIRLLLLVRRHRRLRGESEPRHIQALGHVGFAVLALALARLRLVPCAVGD